MSLAWTRRQQHLANVSTHSVYKDIFEGFSNINMWWYINAAALHSWFNPSSKTTIVWNLQCKLGLNRPQPALISIKAETQWYWWIFIFIIKCHSTSKVNMLLSSDLPFLHVNIWKTCSLPLFSLVTDNKFGVIIFLICLFQLSTKCHSGRSCLFML